MDRRVHDRGGWPGAGSIDRTEHMEAWEKELDALFFTLPNEVMSTDELRRGVEALGLGEYERLGYYGRWLESVEAVLLEKGVVTPSQLGMARWEPVATPGPPKARASRAPAPQGSPKPRFRPGDRVRVRKETNPGHHRTPGYVQGRVGVVERAHGWYRDPESLAYGGDGLPERFLYSIAFPMEVLWDGYHGAPGDRLAVDVYEHWLEPAGGK